MNSVPLNTPNKTLKRLNEQNLISKKLIDITVRTALTTIVKNFFINVGFYVNKFIESPNDCVMVCQNSNKV